MKSIHDFIARDSAHYATDFVLSLRHAATTLIDNPFLGRMTPEFEPSGLRQLSHRGYRIIYLVDEKFVSIVGVVHGARDLKSLWEREDRPTPQRDDPEAEH